MEIITEIVYIIRCVSLAVFCILIFIAMFADREKTNEFFKKKSLLARICAVLAIIGFLSFIIDLPKIWGWVY